MSPAELEAIEGPEQLRRCAESLGYWRWFDRPDDARHWEKYSAEELLAIWRAMCLSGFDLYPDQWSEAQVRGALLGFVPEFDDEGLPRRLPFLVATDVQVYGEPEGFRRLQ